MAGCSLKQLLCLICAGDLALILAYGGSWLCLWLLTLAIVFYVLASLGFVSLLPLRLMVQRAHALRKDLEKPPARSLGKTEALAEALRELKRFKEEGLLSEEEYEKLRKGTVESQAQEDSPREQTAETARQRPNVMRGKDSEAYQFQRTTALLYDVFPRHVAQTLRDGVGLMPERRDLATVFFSDIVGFTAICSRLTAEKVLDMLHRLYCKFDRLSAEFGVFKVETIGDAYMGVTNLISDQSTDHAKRVAHFAWQAVRVANETRVDLDNASLGCINIRAGFDCGPIVAGVVGTRNRRYCLFGDTVNVASRMESASEANRVLCSERAAKVLWEQAPEVAVQRRGTIPVKGKGEMETYWVKCSDHNGENWPGQREHLAQSQKGKSGGA
eukprot:CAMPEP_0179040458 /NCGR_PEP_ID=MMETSP0796-20121207/15658_1 /TAXON_ID=73915 /ORGANISM="Pyrodinium bahamense, Strain pbaha01" /LENGTH=385 /DNA_ID=CAMNT_0020736805 /DNA_START=96 /DNA_END=1253 /DNA_ORIENTATION=+